MENDLYFLRSPLLPDDKRRYKQQTRHDKVEVLIPPRPFSLHLDKVTDYAKA